MARESAHGGLFAEVTHIDLDAGPDTVSWTDRMHDGRRLVVFWAGDRPVGQLVVQPREDPVALVAEFVASSSLSRVTQPAASTQGPVSVVICSRDRPDQLARCLASLPGQSRPPDEVIVVDNASTESRTRDVAGAAGVRYVREDRPGLDIARNTGLRTAGSEIVAFTDDDTELHPRWLERLVGAFDDERVMAVTGLVLPAELDTQAQWLFETEWGFGRGFSRVDLGSEFYQGSRSAGTPAWEIGAGANMAFRRAVTEQVGFFDERLDVGAAGCSGDSEYWYRIIAAGWTCRYEPSAVVFHHHRREMGGLRSQLFHYMRGHVTALLVQYERTGDRGNLRRAFVTLPRYYARRIVRTLVRGRRTQHQMLRAEVFGALAGIGYYSWARWLQRTPCSSAT